MPKIRYEDWNPGPDVRVEIRRAEAICRQYAAQGYDLTLRQLHYQFVASGWIANNLKSYKRLGEIINKARLAGLLDWDYIVDRTRNLAGTRDIRERIENFLTQDWLNQNMPAAEGPVKVGEILAHMRDAVGDVQPVEVRRIALNYDQVLAYHPPPNPAKLTDSRANGYIDEHGHDSWELDALRPDVLADLIRQHVAGIRDEDAYDAIAAQETRHRDLLTLASERWADVVAYLDTIRDR